MRFGKHGETPNDEPMGIEGLRPLGDASLGTEGGAGTEVPTIPFAAGGESAGGVGDDPAPNPYAPGADAAATSFIGVAGAGAADGMDEAEREAYAKLKAMRAERRRKKLIHRGIAAGVVAALVLGVFVFNLVKSNSTDTEVPVVTQAVYTGTVSTEVTGSGSIEPVSSNVVQPQIDGTIETVDVVAGQQVKAGDVLFTIKNDDLDRAVNEAARAVRSAKQKVNEAQKALDDAKSQASYVAGRSEGSTGRPTGGATIAQAGLARAATLRQVDGQTSSEADSTAGSSGTTSDDPAIASAQNELEAAQIELEAANDAYAKATEQADQRIVKSPIDGSVIELNAQVGASVGQGSSGSSGTGSGTLCQVADLSQMMVTVQVSEVDINEVALDQNATATFSALPNVNVAAQVRSVASTTSSDGGYGSGGATYAVQLVIPEPAEGLKPGMTANVSITTSQVDSALVVPSAALTTYGDGTGAVFVETDPNTHDATAVTVEVLADNGSEAAVKPTDGSLADGDQVIVSGMGGDASYDGMSADDDTSDYGVAVG